MIVIHHTLSRQYGATKIAFNETFRRSRMVAVTRRM